MYSEAFGIPCMEDKPNTGAHKGKAGLCVILGTYFSWIISALEIPVLRLDSIKDNFLAPVITRSKKLKAPNRVPIDSIRLPFGRSLI